MLTLKVHIDADKAGLTRIEAQLVRAAIHTHLVALKPRPDRVTDPSEIALLREAAQVFADSFFPETSPHTRLEWIDDSNASR